MLDHRKEVVGRLVLTGGDAAKRLSFEKSRSIRLRSQQRCLQKQGFQRPIALRWNVGRGALLMTQFADVI